MSVLFKKYLRTVFLIPLRIKFFIKRMYAGKDTLTFRCNICGNVCTSQVSEIKKREAQSCYHCGSTLRFRTIIAALTEQLFRKMEVLPRLSEDKQIVGVGMSDVEIYAAPLRNKFSYTNTYYHKEPKLDITALKIESHNTADFVISTDIFEHVPPPVDVAFTNLYKLLKVGGVCIFSVPYRNDGDTVEHFPELYNYKLVQREGGTILANTTRDGRNQEFDNLCFHGGDGETLEMRIFSKSSLLKEIRKAGFREIRLYETSIPDYGILLNENTPSLIISMRKT